MWEIAEGFHPRLEGLTETTLHHLAVFAEKVHAAGGQLLLTSAYRPGGRTLHGRGMAVDVWVPGWTHEQIATKGMEAGFLGGYIPQQGNFVELVTGGYTYTVPGQKFGRAEVFGPTRPQGFGPPQPEFGPPAPSPEAPLLQRIFPGLSPLPDAPGIPAPPEDAELPWYLRAPWHWPALEHLELVEGEGLPWWLLPPWRWPVFEGEQLTRTGTMLILVVVFVAVLVIIIWKL
ncbi:MAG TPA: hypothetical protein VLH15_04330 [Dehalococcoidales bacterium]|nr:hypothetical protein [Dehalococcoidales bacterium]